MTDTFDPFELAAMRTRRSVRSPARYQEPMPEGVPPTLSGIATSAADPMGLPSWLVGQISPEARDAWRAQYENDPGGSLIGSLLTGGAAAKGVGAVAAPVLNAARAAPKTVGALMGLTAASEAGEPSDLVVEVDPTQARGEIDKLRTQISSDRASLDKQATTNFRSTVARNNAAKPYLDSISNAEARISELQGQIDRTVEGERKRAQAQQERERPLVEQKPWLQFLPAAGGAAAFGSAYIPRLRQVTSHNEFVDRMLSTVPKVERAAAGTAKKVSGQDRLAAAQGQEYVGAYPGVKAAVDAPTLGDKLSAMSTPALGGGMLAGELSMLPSQIDYATQRPGTAANDAARERFFSGPGWLKTATSSLQGLTGGSLGTIVPTLNRPAFADMPRLQGALEAYRQRTQGPLAAPIPGPMQGSGTPIPPGLVPWVVSRRQQRG